jgi:outer membrane protein TolC
LIAAQYEYRTALDGLRRLIGADLTAALRGTDIVLDDDPEVLPDKSSILPFEKALEKALLIRPELDAAQKSTLVDDLNARIARNLLKPKLDLTLQGGTTGLGGNQVPIVGPLGVTIPGSSTGLPETLTQMGTFKYPSYGAGLQLTLPLRNSAAQADLADALINRTRDQYQARLAQQQIILDVRQALNSLELANASIEAATRVLLSSYVGYQQAYIRYQRAVWTLLDGLGMVLEKPTKP